jgi:GT2 family glycosyltransferase
MMSEFHDFIGTLNGRFAGDGDGDEDADTLLYTPSCNLSICVKLARDISPDLSLFDESFPTAAFEDIELCLRAKDHHVVVRLAQDAIVSHRFEESLMGLTKQYFRYGKSEALMVRKHPKYPIQLATAFRKEEGPCGRRLPPGSMLRAEKRNDRLPGFYQSPLIARRQLASTSRVLLQ